MERARNLISCPSSRRERRNAKTDAVLRFLRQHLWSTQDILQQVMGLLSRQAAHKSLVAMEQEGNLRRHTFFSLGGRVTIWGITCQGQAMAFDPGTEQIVSATFDPNRVSEQTIHHQLDLQCLRLAAEKAGWRDWVDGDRLGESKTFQKRPDALLAAPDGRRVALECERSFKSLKRYQSILLMYLQLIKLGEINCVVWVSPTPEMAARLKAIMTSITEFRFNGQTLHVSPDRHHLNLHFVSYADWPSLKDRPVDLSE